MKEADGFQAEVRIAAVTEQCFRHLHSLSKPNIVGLNPYNVAGLLFEFNHPKTQEHRINAACVKCCVPDGLRIGD